MSWKYVAMASTVLAGLVVPRLLVAESQSSARCLKQTETPVTVDDGVSNPDLMLVISGGISRGAYQAGQMYVLSNWLKELGSNGIKEKFPDSSGKVTVAGSSAGSISAVITAIELASEEKKGEDSDGLEGEKPKVWSSPEESLFFRTWVPLGFDNTDMSMDSSWYEHPKDHQSLINPQLLEAIAAGLAEVATNGGKSETAPACLAELDGKKVCLPERVASSNGLDPRLVVTAARHQPVDSSGAGISSDVTLAFGFKMNGTCNPQILKTRCEADWASRDARAPDVSRCVPSVQWANVSDTTVEMGRMTRLAIASSSIPLAFPLFPLECKDLEAMSPWQDTSGMCNPSGGEEVIWLIDGGTLEGNPVRAAKPFAARDNSDAKKHPHFLYMDPDLEGSAQHVADHHDEMSERYLQLLGSNGGSGSIVSAMRNQSISLYLADHPELISPDRKNDLAHLLVTETPPYGNYMGGFLAFYERSFRVWDFYAGMYDTLRWVEKTYGKSFADKIPESSPFGLVTSCRTEGAECPAWDTFPAGDDEGDTPSVKKSLQAINDMKAIIPAGADQHKKGGGKVSETCPAVLWENLRLLSHIHQAQVKASNEGSPWSIDELAAALDKGAPEAKIDHFIAQDLGPQQFSLELRQRVRWQVERVYKREILSDSLAIDALVMVPNRGMLGGWGNWKWGLTTSLLVDGVAGFQMGPGIVRHPEQRLSLVGDFAFMADFPNRSFGDDGAERGWGRASGIEAGVGLRAGLLSSGAKDIPVVLGPRYNVYLTGKVLGDALTAVSREGIPELRMPLLYSGNLGDQREVGVNLGLALRLDVLDMFYLQGNAYHYWPYDTSILDFGSTTFMISSGIMVPLQLPWGDHESSRFK